MSKTVSFRGGKAIASVFASSGAAVPFPVFTLPTTYKSVGTDGNPAALYAAFTPSSTSVTINPTGENAITFTNATASEYLCTNDPIAAAHFFAATARRKPGTTGAIAAQTVVITVNSVEIGRFNVESAAASANPRVGFTSFFNVAGDSRMTTDGQNIAVAVTAADTDLEIILFAAGYTN